MTAESAAAQPDGLACVDAAAAARLGVSRGTLAGLIQRYADGLPRVLDVLAEAVTAQDYQAISLLAHSLSGAAGTLALARLQWAAAAMEMAGREGTGSLDRLLVMIQAEALPVIAAYARPPGGEPEPPPVAGPAPAAGAPEQPTHGPDYGDPVPDNLNLFACRVLLVDDNKSNLDVLVEILGSKHQLSLASSGEAALASIAESPPDLVVLDLLMPGLDGYEVCRRLRADPATHDLPIILLSALGEPKSKARAFEAGGSDYITKPVEAVELIARVRALLRSKVYQDAARFSLTSELRVAQEIQRGMMPKDFSGLGGDLPIEVYARLEPAKEVGGDLYGVFPLGGGRVCVVLGDVSGKGIPAAIFMAITATLLRATARHVDRPEQILSHVNQELARDNPSSMFVTLFCAVLDTKTGRLAFASGGHTSPVLVRPGEPPRLLLGRVGTLVGIEPGLAFEARELQLAPGDGLLLYTDGVTEAFDAHGNCFGEDHLLLALRGSATGARTMVEGVLAAVRTFAGAEKQSDDIALLALRWLPPSQLELTLYSTSGETVRGYRSVQAFLSEHQAPDDVVHDVGLAVEEVLSNLVRHGYSGTEGPISVRVYLDQVAVKVEVRDRGVFFDPRTAPAPHLEVPLDERPSGDLGIHLVRHAVDRIAYTREGSENLLTLVRDLHRQPTKE